MPSPTLRTAETTVYAVLFAISFSHLLNDTIQALLVSIYPLLKESYHLTFSQLGMITFAFQVTASLLQPLVLVHRQAQPAVLIAHRHGADPVRSGGPLHGRQFCSILGSAALVGMGSAIFHPEASRIAHMAAGRRRGLAQSLFQVGGNAGSSIGPLLAA
nr:hypothetical protein [Verrucomicrobium spinosum]